MLEIYNVLRKDKTIGILKYKDGEKQIQFIEGISITEYPAFFHTQIRNGQYVFNTPEVDSWISRRVPPQYRQDISDVLKAMSIKKYNQWEMFKYYNGNSRDTIFISRAN